MEEMAKVASNNTADLVATVEESDRHSSVLLVVM